MLNLQEVDGFEWDEANLYKNWEKHRVSYTECEEVFFNTPLLLNEDVGHSGQEMRYFVLGRTNAQRLLFIAFTVRNAKLRVISARPMSKKERQIYAQANT